MHSKRGRGRGGLLDQGRHLLVCLLLIDVYVLDVAVCYTVQLLLPVLVCVCSLLVGDGAPHIIWISHDS